MPTFLVTWLDGTHEYIAEDLEPYDFTRDARDGLLQWQVRQPAARHAMGLRVEVKTDCAIEWLKDAESRAMWPRVGFPADQPDITQLGPEEGV